MVAREQLGMDLETRDETMRTIGSKSEHAVSRRHGSS
jgi:hypothetical protein